MHQHANQLQAARGQAGLLRLNLNPEPSAGKAAAGRSAAQESSELHDTLIEHTNVELSSSPARRRQEFHEQHADHLGRPRHLACADRWLFDTLHDKTKHKVLCLLRKL